MHGEDDVSVREYRSGDDLRKVHWRATARTGELMVRLEERPWRAQATLLLDTRARAHLVAPTHAPSAPAAVRPGTTVPPGDSLEWLVEAAASIGTALARRGAVLRTITDAGELLPTSGHGRLSPDDLLDRLAGVGPSRVSSLAAGVEQLCRAAGDGPVICLLGAVGPDDVADLIRRPLGAHDRPGGAGRHRELGRRRAHRAPRRCRPRRAGALARQREDAATLLRAAGWRVADARADRSVADVWADLGGPARAPSPAPAAHRSGCRHEPARSRERGRGGRRDPARARSR